MRTRQEPLIETQHTPASLFRVSHTTHHIKAIVPHRDQSKGPRGRLQRFPCGGELSLSDARSRAHMGPHRSPRAFLNPSESETCSSHSFLSPRGQKEKAAGTHSGAIARVGGSIGSAKTQKPAG